MKSEVSGGTRFVASSDPRPRRIVALHRAIVVSLAVVAGILAFWGTRLAVCPKPAPSPLGALGVETHLKTELGLTDRQTSEIHDLDGKLAAQLSDQCGRYCAVRAELGAALMTEGTNSVEMSRRLVDQMCAIQAASELATLEHIRKVSALLNPDQRKQFLSNLTRCLCGGEGLCAGGCRHE